jgi:polyhydroxybutyrate depolymerase
MTMRRAAWLGMLAASVGLAACSTGSNASPPASSSATTGVAPTAISSPSPDSSSSLEPRQIIVGRDRPATVRLASAVGDAPAPLLIVLHGYSQPPAEQQAYLGLDAYAADVGAVVAYPEGTRDRDGNRFWNATDVCCNFYGSDVDDVAYLVSLVDEIGRTTPIDAKRVYLVGHSNGGFMSYRVACERAEVFAALVSLAGATYDNDDDCAPSEPVAILEIHGSADNTILFEGGTLDFGGTEPRPPYPGAKSTVTTWAAYDSCATTLATSPEKLDVDAWIAGPDGPEETTVETATECPPGGHAELWTIPGGSHAPNLSRTFATSVIDFLLAHPKP